jgi:hypothetical protein
MLKFQLEISFLARPEDALSGKKFEGNKSNLGALHQAGGS